MHGLVSERNRFMDASRSLFLALYGTTADRYRLNRAETMMTFIGENSTDANGLGRSISKVFLGQGIKSQIRERA
jgi:hypothetical protein